MSTTTTTTTTTTTRDRGDRYGPMGPTTDGAYVALRCRAAPHATARRRNAPHRMWKTCRALQQHSLRTSYKTAAPSSVGREQLLLTRERDARTNAGVLIKPCSHQIISSERTKAGIPRRRHGHRHRLAQHGYNLTSDTRYFIARILAKIFVSVSVSAS